MTYVRSHFGSRFGSKSPLARFGIDSRHNLVGLIDTHGLRRAVLYQPCHLAALTAVESTDCTIWYLCLVATYRYLTCSTCLSRRT